MLTIDLSYAATHTTVRPGIILDAPESAHDALRYAAGLAGLSGHELMDREMHVYTAWVSSMSRWHNRPTEETQALERARVLIDAERAKRDPKYGLLLKEKRA